MSYTDTTSHSNESERRIVLPIEARLRAVRNGNERIVEAIEARDLQVQPVVVQGLFSPFVGQEVTTEIQTPSVDAARHQGAIAIESGMTSATTQEKMMVEAQEKAKALAQPIGEPDVYLGQIAA